MMQNKIYLGDSYELIKQLPDKSIDLIITDPPYMYTSGGGGGCFGIKNRSYHQEYLKVSDKTYRQNDDKIRNRNQIASMSTGIDYKILDQFVRVLKKINIYIYVSKHMIPTILNYFIDKGCTFEIMMWGKTNPLPTANNTYLNDIEYLLFFREKGVRIDGTYETKSKFYISGSNTSDKAKYEHPTIKPLEMVKNLVLNSSAENDIILDPFIGSGTTAVACKELNRNYIGFEINEKYHSIAIDRLNGFTRQEKRLMEQGFLNLFNFEVEE